MYFNNLGIVEWCKKEIDEETVMQREVEAWENKVYDVAMEAGHILLQNGAEISRVEETMDRICKYYGEENSDFLQLRETGLRAKLYNSRIPRIERDSNRRRKRSEPVSRWSC